jgi:hypothetical protein
MGRRLGSDCPLALTLHNPINKSAAALFNFVVISSDRAAPSPAAA